MKIIECPRDAMQGIKEFIPTKKKIDYINQLLKVGFDTIDFGSFVSEKAIPQLKDTSEVLSGLDLSSSSSKLLSIIANIRGAEDACNFDEINYLGFPLSVSEEFQKRNTNKSINESFEALKRIKIITDKNNKKLVVYLSMGFGNPYGEPWNYEIVEKWIDKLSDLEIQVISLSDTIGTAVPDDIFNIFSNIIPRYIQVEFGAHFHTRPDDWFKKIDSAFRAGCKRFDGAIQGFGGCPMAKDELTGNLPTEKLISYFNSINKKPNINSLNFESCYNHALRLFNDFK